MFKIEDLDFSIILPFLLLPDIDFLVQVNWLNLSLIKRFEVNLLILREAPEVTLILRKNKTINLSYIRCYSTYDRFIIRDCIRKV